METTGENYLSSVRKLFRYYKSLGDGAIAQVSAGQLNWQPGAESNSMAVIMKHIAGNSLSRWSDFLNSDGEKPLRNRDQEFEGSDLTHEEILELWERGWQCIYDAIDPLTDADLERTIYIRNEGHTVTEAVNRQLAHIPYHVGQLVYIAKMVSGPQWQALTIAKGESQTYNAGKFSADKEKKFFTDGK